MLNTVKRIAAGLAATFTATALAISAGAAPAYADDAFFGTYPSGQWLDGAGFLWFYHYGDRIVLADEAADGAGVYGEWKHGVTTGSMYLGTGANTYKEWNLEFPEDVWITLKVCLRDNGVIQQATCSSRLAKNSG